MMISGQNMKKKKKYEDEYLNVHLQMALQFCTLCHKLVEKRKLNLRRMVLVLIQIYWFHRNCYNIQVVSDNNFFNFLKHLAVCDNLLEEAGQEICLLH